MADITPTNSLNINDELDKLDLYKYHSNGILNVSLNRLKDMLDGKVEITDPSNPFTYLLETSALNTAFAVQEFTLLSRKLYPRLANTEADLYRHMSDYDYLGIFSEPAYGQVNFNILFNDFQTRAKYNVSQKEYTLKIPRHLKITIDTYIFTLPSAIIVRLTDSGIIDVKYENQDFNNLFPIETNYINFNLTRVNQEETYINFTIKLPEIDIEPLEIPIEKSKLFKNTMTFNPNRQFYFFRAFYYQDSSWKEMIITHTDEVYDINNPTCIVKVSQVDHTVDYYIPPVYINTGLVTNKVKFLIYTTKGYINVNFADFAIGSFSTEYNPVFPDEELDEQTEPLQLISKVIYLQDKIVGGKNSISFNDLKNSVIENSIGDRQLPITNKQNEFSLNQNNFKIIRDVDVVTNRIFLLECQVPTSLTRYPITKINLDIIEYKTTVADLKNYGNNIIDIDQYTTIIPENTVFKQTEDGIQILTQQEYEIINGLSDITLTSEMNNNTYISTMYHYVLDTSSNETELRAYDISSPLIKMINFKEFNPTARVGINTTNTTITKTQNGYTIDVLANLKKYVNTINETNVKPYLVYTDNNQAKFYLEGRLYTTINENPVYRFDIETQYYIDKTNLLNITNFKDLNEQPSNIFLDLTSKLSLIYVSNTIPPNYIASTIDSYIYGSYLSVGKCVVTLEEFTIQFCQHLKYLYSQCHTSTGVREYEVYSEDIPMRYSATVYDAGNNIIHMVNDLMYDTEGNIIYKHLAGEVVLDENNNPIVLNSGELVRYLNLFFIDYRAILATKKNTVDYRKYIRNYLTENITANAESIQNQLLENTQAFVVVPKNIDTTTVKTTTRTITMSCLQTFKVEVHVNENIYNDNKIRDNINYTIISLIDNYLYNNTILRKTELLDILYNALKEYIESISMSQFTELNEEYIEILNTNCRIGLNKLLTSDTSGYDLTESIVVSFINVN